MGEYIYDKYKNKVYSIGFTSAFGSMLNIFTNEIIYLKPPTENSLENKLLQLNNNYIFINFQNTKNKLYFNKTMPAKFLGNIEVDGNWQQTLDGMFFIKTLTPLLINK
jgi:erythromycin esterase-like protein